MKRHSSLSKPFVIFFICSIILNYLPDIFPFYTSWLSRGEATVLGPLTNFTEVCRAPPRGEWLCRAQYRLPHSYVSGSESIGLGIILFPIEVSCSDDPAKVVRLGDQFLDGRVSNNLKTYQTLDLKRLNCSGDLVVQNWAKLSHNRYGYSQGPVIAGTRQWIEKTKRLVELSIEGLLSLSAFTFLALYFILRSLQRVTFSSLKEPPFDDFRLYWLGFIFITSGFFFDLLLPFDIPFYMVQRLANFFGLIAIVGPTTQFAAKLNPQFPRIQNVASKLFSRPLPVLLMAGALISAPNFRFTYPWLIVGFGIIGAILAVGNRHVPMLFYSLCAVSDGAKVMMVSNLPGSRTTITYMLFVYAYSMRRQASLLEQSARLEAGSEIAQQLAHDIRSPLTALRMTLDGISADSDTKTLLAEAINRIRAVANDLLERHSPSRDALLEPSQIDIFETLNDVINSKETEYKHAISISLECPDTHVKALVNPGELARIASNILNNAIEAADPTRALKITVRIHSVESGVEIVFADNGRGIETSALRLVGSRGFTTKHESQTRGNGLGLFNAKKTITRWGGSLEVHSKLHQGTQVKMVLPRQ